MRLPVIDSHERPDICGPCGGKCCTIWPGIPHPEDLGAPDREALRATATALVASGRWVVDHDAEGRIDGEPYDWYLRPALKGTEGSQPDQYGFEGPGTCTFLVGGRCEIYDARPRGCRMLVPDTDVRNCKSPIRKIDEVQAWEPYESILLAIRSTAEGT
jgi:Fe-S-cluster containining protein